MTEAIFGFVGVILDAAIPWLQAAYADRKAIRKKASYLAIRIVCKLDKFIEDCGDVIMDNGLAYGQRTPEGYLSPQVSGPNVLIFPEDVDWKSIDHELMYKILSRPSAVTDAEKMIKNTEKIAEHPDFEDWFLERRYQYSLLGLHAYHLSKELSTKYKIKLKTYNNWNPEEAFKSELERVTPIIGERMRKYQEFAERVLAKVKK